MHADHQIRNRRFLGFLFTSILLTGALYLARAELYAIYAASLGTIFSVYATGQSFTDGKISEHGKAK
jgi:hypothetical protein